MLCETPGASCLKNSILVLQINRCMKRTALFAALLLCFAFSFAQKHESFFDFSFQPSKNGGYYYVVTEKTDSGWHRTAYYLSQQTLAMDGLYKDEECKTANGLFKWYGTNRYLKSKGWYVNGQKEGAWLHYTEEGLLKDSMNYKADHLMGASFTWFDDGFMEDSLQFDGQGNGTEVSWHKGGILAHTGRRIQDTLRQGRWKYYRANGKPEAVRDYVAGKEVACQCWDEAGTELDTALCREREAEIIGGAPAWRHFLETHLQTVIEKAARIFKPGQYTLAIRFLVEKDGSISDVKPLTAYGHGIEEAVVKIFKDAPRWTPGYVYGKAVRSYHTQPITFLILEQ